MLGESKYFQARYPDRTTNRLVIEEVEVDDNGVPNLDGGLADNTIWGEEPITIISESDTSGKRSGVYWETEKPVWDGLNKRGNLAEGLIRVIGRYWHKDSSYVVNLRAVRNSDTAKVKIKVVSPTILLSQNYNGLTYARAKDVFDKEYSIDSLCIYYGGLNGIPPQMIKGQMKTESATKEFTFKDGTSATGFAPSYRYEPYTTQFNETTKRIVKTNTYPFIVTETAMQKEGASHVPTHSEHKYVQSNHYFEEPQNAWDIIKANSRLVDINNESTTYGFQYQGTRY